MSERRRNIRRSSDFYKHAVKLLRKYADGFTPSDGYNLRYYDDWSPSMKGRVTRVFQAVDELTARPYKVIRPRSRKNLRRLQQAAQHEAAPKALKVAFVPVADPDAPVAVTYTKRAVKIRQKGVEYITVDIDPQALIEDPQAAAQAVVREFPAKVYTLQAGKYEIREPLYTARQVGNAITKYQNKYNADDYNSEDPNSSYFGNWMHGVRAYNYETRFDMKQFRADRRAARRDLKAARRAQKRKIKRMIKSKR